MSDPGTIPFHCEALIDQGHTIGDDPVGCRCLQYATASFVDDRGLRRHLCSDCAADFRAHGGTPPGRVTLPPVREEQGAAIARVVKDMMACMACHGWRSGQPHRACTCVLPMGLWNHDPACPWQVDDEDLACAWHAKHRGETP